MACSILYVHVVLVVQVSRYGGSAWSYDHVREQYYYHYYNAHMPDFNYRDPSVVAELHVRTR